MNRRGRAILALVATTSLWGLSFPLMRMINVLMVRAVPAAPGGMSTASILVDQVTRASFYMAVRFAMAMAFLGLAAPGLFRGLTAAEWGMGIGVGLPFAAGFLFQVAGLNEIPSSRSGFLTSLCVAFTPIVMIAVERRRPRIAAMMGASIAILGTAFLTGLFVAGGPIGLRLSADVGARVGLGDGLTIAAAFIFAFQVVAVDLFARRMPSERLTAGMFLGVVVVAAVVGAAGALARPSPSGFSGWTALLADVPFLVLTAITAALCSTLAFWLMNRFQPEVSPVQASSIYTMEPVFATLWALWLPGLLGPAIGVDEPSEHFHASLLIGGTLIILGNVVGLSETPRDFSTPESTR